MDYIESKDDQLQVADETTPAGFHELNELQLVTAGGGCGETVFH